MSREMRIVLAMLLLVVILLVGSAIMLSNVVVGSVPNESMTTTEDIGEFKNSRDKDSHIYMYVFNDKTQLWDRAREETLKNASCKRLHGYTFYEESK